MKRLKLDLTGIGKMLSKEQMKLVIGGNDYGSYVPCSTVEDCATGQKCITLPGSGLPPICSDEVPLGTSCTVDSDCGKDRKCKPLSSPLTGNACYAS